MKTIRTVIAILLVLLIFFPIFWMIKISFSAKSEVFKIPPNIVPKKINLEGYKYFFNNSIFQRYYLNSVIVATGTVLLCLFAGILAAYSFSRFKYRARNPLMVFVLTAQMFPWALLIITLYLFFSKLRLLDTYFSLILAHSTFAIPLTTWIIKSYFDTIPRELEESAYIDGSGQLFTLFKIILPISKPGIIASMIYIFIFSWNDFIFGLALTSKNEMRILAPGIQLSFVGQYEYLWVEMMACSILVTLPIAFLFLFFQRYFIAGLTAGAVKE
jgi:multiple sugar transport system permease protein